MEKITALMPMKGHSERVPNKNIKDFANKPLLAHIIDSLDNCEQIDSIIINTDSDKIATLCKKVSGKVVIHERPPELQGDFVSMNKIIEYDIHKSSGEHYLQTHSTNPLIRATSFESGIKKYFEVLGEYDSLFSVTRYQTRLYDEDGNAVNHDPKELIRTQDLPPLYEENSCFYMFSKESFAKNQARIGNKPYMFEIDKIESIDIDTPEDFEIAETICLLKNKGNL